MRPFDRVIVADWSAAGQLSPARPSENAIWLGICDGASVETLYYRSRAEAEAEIVAQIAANRGRLLIGFDFPMGYPTGFAGRLTGTPRAKAVWSWLGRHLQDGPDNRNNRFEVAASINRHFGMAGPFWGRPASQVLLDLPERKSAFYPDLGLAERRLVETIVPKAQPVWKLYTTGAAGSQGLVGQAMLDRLVRRAGVEVWPFDPAEGPVVMAEVYPSLLARKVAAEPAGIKDEIQVRLLSRALWRLGQAERMTELLATPGGAVATEEGWILGAGFSKELEAAV